MATEVASNRRWRSGAQPGQSLVEFALIGTILAIILLGVIELVSMYNAKSYLTDASRSGVRLASLAYDDLSIANSVWVVLHSHGMTKPVNGVCNVTELDIYKANADGSLDTSTPNNQDRLFSTVVGQDCQFWIQYDQEVYGANYLSYDTHDYFGFPVAQRHAQLQAPGGLPIMVGIKIVYTYRMRTPVLSAFGTSMVIAPQSVQALGGDNANDLLNVPTSTPVNTFTFTPTPSATFTPSATPTDTPKPTDTPVPPPTNTPTTAPTGTPCSGTCPDTETPTDTPAPPPTNTPSITPTVTPLPLPVVSVALFGDCAGGGEAGWGISIGFTGVPGATSYNIYYVSGTSTVSVGTVNPGSPGGSGQFPPVAPYYRDLAANSYFEVRAVVGGVEQPPGISSPPFSTACSAPSS